MSWIERRMSSWLRSLGRKAHLHRASLKTQDDDGQVCSGISGYRLISGSSGQMAQGLYECVSSECSAAIVCCPMMLSRSVRKRRSHSAQNDLVKLSSPEVYLQE